MADIKNITYFLENYYVDASRLQEPEITEIKSMANNRRQARYVDCFVKALQDDHFSKKEKLILRLCGAQKTTFANFEMAWTTWFEKEYKKSVFELKEAEQIEIIKQVAEINTLETTYAFFSRWKPSTLTTLPAKTVAIETLVEQCINHARNDSLEAIFIVRELAQLLNNKSFFYDIPDAQKTGLVLYILDGLEKVAKTSGRNSQIYQIASTGLEKAPLPYKNPQ